MRRTVRIVARAVQALGRMEATTMSKKWAARFAERGDAACGF
jgi:hypothetical protein